MPALQIPLPLVLFAKIMESELAPVEWVIEPVIAKGDRVIIYGEYGSMKSWLLLDMGLHIAAGEHWLNQFKVPSPARVLYLDEEMNSRTLQRRIRRLGIERNFRASDIPFAHLSQVGITFNADGAGQLLEALNQSQFDPDIIIIETLRRVIVGSENEAESVGAFWRNLQPLRVSGKTIIISHHMRKPNPNGWDDNRHRASGSTDILAGADSGFAVMRKGNALQVQCVKSREAEEVKPFLVAFQEGQGNERPISMQFESFNETSNAQRPESQVEKANRLIQDYVSRTTERHAATEEILAYLSGFGITERTAQRTLSRIQLLSRGKIYKESKGVWAVTEPSSEEQ
ncbi:MAG: AAA family ATPase [Nitrospira sp.]